MQYQIDQSGKIEHTSKTTIVACANGSVRSIKISAKEKQKLIRIIKIKDAPKKTFVFKIFAGLIFILIKNLNIQSIYIDREYAGHEAIIRNFLIHLYKKSRRKPPSIYFIEIGKKSPAHKAALETYQEKRRPDVTVTSNDISKLFYEK